MIKELGVVCMQFIPRFFCVITTLLLHLHEPLKQDRYSFLENSKATNWLLSPTSKMATCQAWLPSVSSICLVSPPPSPGHSPAAPWPSMANRTLHQHSTHSPKPWLPSHHIPLPQEALNSSLFILPPHCCGRPLLPWAPVSVPGVPTSLLLPCHAEDIFHSVNGFSSFLAS